jgi:cobalt-zinc-cadmium efflux system membrane fusion protein
MKRKIKSICNRQYAISKKFLLQISHCLLPIAYCLLLISCNDQKEEQKSEPVQNENSVELTDAQLNNANIETGKIQRRSISSLLKASGSVDVPPQNMVSISAPLGGYLKSTKLLEGMHISKGESIAVMEDQQYITLQHDYLAAKSKLVFEEEEYSRQEELNKSKATSDKIFQEAKMNYSNQKVLVKSLSEKLKLIGINPDNLDENNLSRSISIPSPIDGYVSHVNINIGKYVNPSDILFELVNPTDIHLALNIFEKDIDKLFIGQKLIAYTNNNPDKKYPCEINIIGKDLSHERSVEVHCHFEKYDAVLIPGMFMNAEIEVHSSNAYVIPTDAIVRFEGKQFVFTQSESKTYEMLEVNTGNSENGFTQIAFVNGKDLSNETFVTTGAYTLLMKMKNTEEE